MNFIDVPTYREMSERAANIIIQGINDKRSFTLGLAADPSLIGTYQWLSDGNRRGKVDFQGVSAVGLGEYVGLSAADPQSSRAFMNGKLLEHINIKPENICFPNGMATDPAEEGAGYDQRLEELGGIDLALLCLEEDGSIGFGGPSEAFQKGTHEVGLNEDLRLFLARFFGSREAAPKRALAVGLLSVMEAKKIVLLVSGESKKAILDKAFSGEVTPRIPASILQGHPDITVIYSPQ